MSFFSKQLKYVRTRNRLTQQQLSDVLGITRSAYCGYETGRRKPDLDAIVTLSKFYRISPEKLILEPETDIFNEDSNYESEADKIFLSELSRAEAEIIVNFRRADYDGRIKILDAAEEAVKDL